MGISKVKQMWNRHSAEPQQKKKSSIILQIDPISPKIGGPTNGLDSLLQMEWSGWDLRTSFVTVIPGGQVQGLTLEKHRFLSGLGLPLFNGSIFN